MDEYASILFMLDWDTAMRFPTVIVSPARIASQSVIGTPAGSNTSKTSRNNDATAAAFGATERNATIGVGVYVWTHTSVLANLRHANQPDAIASMDPLERLLLQVTRKNDARGYERFRDLFEAIVAYNE